MSLASALSTALTGLSASETMISVAGNNISNSTTNGFKQSSADFTTQFLQTLSLGAGPSTTNGGTNPEQIGLGTQLAQITPDFTQGTITPSSSPANLAIQGDGFFIVQGTQGQQYTRNGDFQLNSENQLVTSTGQNVLGFGVNSNYQIGNTLQSLTIPLGSTAVAQATQNVYLQGDLSPTETVSPPNGGQVIQSQILSDASIAYPTAPASSPIGETVLAPPDVSSTTNAVNPAGGSLNADTYTYEVTFSNSAGQVEEGPPSAPISVTTTGTTSSVELDNLPAIPAGFDTMNIYRAGSTGPYGLVGTVSASSGTPTTFIDTGATPPTAQTPPSSLNAGTYNYYVTYYNPITGVESRPSAVIGPQSIGLDGRSIELSNVPAPPAGSGFTETRIYRNTSTDPSTYYLDNTLSTPEVSGTTPSTYSYIDNQSDAAISTGNNAKTLDFNGPAISTGTTLYNLTQLNGSTYTQPFNGATQINYTGTKGGDALTTKTLNITSTTTVADLIAFVDQASGIQPIAATATDPGDPNAGGSVGANSTLQFESNTGAPNAVGINLSAFTVKNASGTVPVNLNFATTTPAVGTGPAATSFVAYDSLGDPINVSVTAVLVSSNSAGSTFRWFADSGQNQPSTGSSIAVGTGEVTFNGQGNLISDPNSNIVNIQTSGSSAQPLQFKLDFSQVSGLAQTTSTLAASRQDGSAAGTLSSYNIGGDGIISGVFTNGVTRDLGQVQLARFANNSGLVQDGQNLYSAGVNSGLAIQTTPGAEGSGTIVSSALEGSNTDVGANLVNLITASTEYRSGSQVITTVQTLLDTLLQLRPGQ